MANNKRYIGIDFGTTNSAVVEYKEGYFEKIGDSYGAPFPSVVAVDRLTQKTQCGRDVKNRIIELRENGGHLVFESAKSALDKDEIEYIAGRPWRAEDTARELLSALSKRTAVVTGEPITEAVVAIPIGMSLRKRAALREAALAAGIKVIAFISEPTAAFVSHAKSLRHCRYAAVFDWGGGTLDISILEIRSGCIIERYTDGSNKAGDYIDRLLAGWLHSRLAEKYEGIKLEFENAPPKDRQSLINKAEECKRDLQKDADQCEVTANYAGLKLLRHTVTREDVNDLIKETVSDAVDLLLSSVEKARIHYKEIGRLIVVGGSSNLTALQEELNLRWPYPNILYPENAEWDIANGAALLAANPGCYKTAESVGLILADEKYHSIFPASSQPEESFNLQFGLVEDSTTANFVFAVKAGGERKAGYIGESHAKAFGFRDEVIELESRITEDLVFHAKAKSKWQNSLPVDFIYERLKWMYEIPDEDL